MDKNDCSYKKWLQEMDSLYELTSNALHGFLEYQSYFQHWHTRLITLQKLFNESEEPEQELKKDNGCDCCDCGLYRPLLREYVCKDQINLYRKLLMISVARGRVDAVKYFVFDREFDISNSFHLYARCCCNHTTEEKSWRSRCCNGQLQSPVLFALYSCQLALQSATRHDYYRRLLQSGIDDDIDEELIRKEKIRVVLERLLTTNVNYQQYGNGNHELDKSIDYEIKSRIDDSLLTFIILVDGIKIGKRFDYILNDLDGINNMTPLMHAAEVGVHSCLQTLLEAGAGVFINKKSRLGDFTALMFACLSGNYRGAAMLIAYDADCTVRSRYRLSYNKYINMMEDNVELDAFEMMNDEAHRVELKVESNYFNYFNFFKLFIF